MIKAFFAGLLAPLVFFAVLVQPTSVGAQTAEDGEDPYSYRITQDEFNEYHAAIQNCETPSLECLVRYTTRFVAIEWINDIKGPDIEKTQNFSTEGEQGSSIPGGVIGGTFGLIGMMYENPPANTQTYVADVMNNAGFASPAYAQGLGFASLEPILELWRAFRNIAYFFFIIFFIVLGFMIMFRYKLGGQAAITAQQAIPSVIVSLILVTFSYAIAGFMIDLMYLSMFLIVSFFSDFLTGSLGGPGAAASTGQELINMNIFQLAHFLFTGIWEQTGQTADLISEILSAVASQFSGSLANFGAMVGALTVTLIISIAVVIGVFKLFFELLKSYFTIVVSIVISPILLMFGAIPGRNVFWPWLKTIIGNLAAFPAVLLVVILFLQFTGASTSGVTGGFMPPFLVGVGQAGMIGPLLGLATILALPELVKKIKEVMGAGDGGFGAFIASSAWGGFKEGWGGNVPLGLNARNIVTGVGMAGGAAVAAPTGALIGGAASKARGGTFADGAKTGAMVGGGAVLATPPGLRAVGRVTGFAADLEDRFTKVAQLKQRAQKSILSYQLKQAKSKKPPGASQSGVQDSSEDDRN
ncbi:MAG: hypothetical protein WDZ94_05195 [Patescibacteria group bacterium]